MGGTDREVVSPPFDVAFARPVVFKLVVRPKQSHALRRGACFKTAKGRGVVELRCLDKVEAAAAPVAAFRIAVGSEQPRGPVTHDFSEHAICGLAEDEKEWNFAQHVDQQTATFRVVLEIHAGAPEVAKVVS